VLHISGAGRSMKEVVILSPSEYNRTFVAGPAQFGPNFGINNFVSEDLIFGFDHKPIINQKGLSFKPRYLLTFHFNSEPQKLMTII